MINTLRRIKESVRESFIHSQHSGSDERFRTCFLKEVLHDEKCTLGLVDTLSFELRTESNVIAFRDTMPYLVAER